METVYLINGKDSGSGTVVPARYRIIDKEVGNSGKFWGQTPSCLLASRLGC